MEELVDAEEVTVLVEEGAMCVVGERDGV